VKAIDLTGQRFGKLVVESRHPENTKHGNRRWICRCDCGGEVTVSGGNLNNRHSISCGCVRRPHGGFGTALHNVWCGIKKRCLNSNNHGYKDYGGRGIRICSEWLEFIPFRDWALANGYQKGLQIDRIDVNGNYEPSNCRFVTATVNNQNKRSNVLNPDKVRSIRKLLRNGVKQKDIGNMFGVPQNTISQIKNGHLWASISDTENGHEPSETSASV
jgi:hypothetical protein